MTSTALYLVAFAQGSLPLPLPRSAAGSAPAFFTAEAARKYVARVAKRMGMVPGDFSVNEFAWTGRKVSD